MPTQTITTDAESAALLAEAVGDLEDFKDENGQPRSATAAEVKQHTIDYLRTVVVGYKKRKAARETQTTFNPT